MQRLQILSQGKKSHSWHLWLYGELNNTAHFSPLTNLVNKTTMLSSWDEPHSGAFRAKLLNKTTRVFHPQPNWWVTLQCAAFITSTLRVDIWEAHTYTYMQLILHNTDNFNPQTLSLLYTLSLFLFHSHTWNNSTCSIIGSEQSSRSETENEPNRAKG